MKILLVSMPSLHFFRWTEQLKDAGHEVFWFDITDGGQQVERIAWVHQITGWKLRWNFPGRIFIKKYFSKLYKLIQPFNENKVATIFEKKLIEIQPDAVHSFALYIACSPIYNVMNKFRSIKWIYSSWGSDLYYFQNKPSYLADIKKVLPRIDYLFTDCNRDYQIAKTHGFQGKFLGVFPGGGGFDLEMMKNYMLPLAHRKTILVKGYQGRSGRAIQVLKAIELLKDELIDYKILIFGADKEVVEYSKRSKLMPWENFSVIEKIGHMEVLKLMGKALIYIGNSNSDGMPNTLLEAICMGAFPIQSNPGGATEELIKDGENGLLIENVESSNYIKYLLLEAISNKILIEKAFEINQHEIKLGLERKNLTQKIVLKYSNCLN